MKFSEIVLFGMPNSGKSTIFNALTNGNAKVGNWHGVTVEIKEGLLKEDKSVKVYDLPGVYSLYPVTLEEKTAINKVMQTNGLVVAVIEACTLNIALESVFSLIKKNKRVLIVVNMVKELYDSGGEIDFDSFKKILPVPIVYGEFNTKNGINILLEAIKNYNTESVNLKDFLLSSSGAKKYFKQPKYKESFFDKLALNKFFGSIIFFFIFVIVFYLAFGNYGIGKPLSNLLSKVVVDNLAILVNNIFYKLKVNEFLTGLVLEGIVGGLGGIFVFLPETLVLFIALNFLELTGYMSRVAYLLDDALKNTGLNGRAVFSGLMGLGCTAVAVTTTSNLENDSVRKKAVLTSGMISCSAKIPALMLIASSIKVLSEFSFMIIVYILGAILTYFQIKLSNKVIKGDRVPLIMELPKYRTPKIKDLFNETYKSIKGFIIKICTVIFIISCTLYLLKSLTINMQFIKSGYDKSLLYYLGSVFKYIFYPINLNDWRIGASVISGIFAKEGIASTILALFPNGLPYSIESIIALTVFFYVYTPCITALAVVSQNLGLAFSLKFAVLQFLEALVLSYLTYFTLLNPLISIGLISLIIMVYYAVKIKKKTDKSI